MYLQRLVLSASSQEENLSEEGIDTFLDDADTAFHDPLLEVGGGGRGGTVTSGWRREMKEVSYWIRVVWFTS